MESMKEFRVNESSDSFSGFFGLSKEESQEIRIELETEIAFKDSKESVVKILKKYEDDANKIAWIIFSYGRITQLSTDVREVVEIGSEKFIQRVISKRIWILLNSNASIEEIKAAITRDP